MARPQAFATQSADCLAIDGTGVSMRPEAVAGRLGKDGEATTREVKVLASWRRDDDVPHYDAAIETATMAAAKGEPAFEARILRNAQRTGFGEAPLGSPT